MSAATPVPAAAVEASPTPAARDGGGEAAAAFEALLPADARPAAGSAGRRQADPASPGETATAQAAAADRDAGGGQIAPDPARAQPPAIAGRPGVPVLLRGRPAAATAGPPPGGGLRLAPLAAGADAAPDATAVSARTAASPRAATVGSSAATAALHARETAARFAGQPVSLTVTPAGLRARPGGPIRGLVALAVAAADPAAAETSGNAGTPGAAQAGQADGRAALVRTVAPEPAARDDLARRSATPGPAGRIAASARASTGGRDPAGPAAASVPAAARTSAEAQTAQAVAPPAQARAQEPPAPAGRPAADPLPAVSLPDGHGHEAVARGSQTASPPPAPRPAPSAPPAEQVAVHVQRAVAAGQQRLTVQLHPAELGRIDVRLDVADDGHVRAALTVDRRETLELLQREARALERALNEAGLKADAGALDFGLRGEGGGRQDGGDDAADHAAAASVEPAEPAAEAAAAAPPAGAVPATAGGVDIHV